MKQFNKKNKVLETTMKIHPLKNEEPENSQSILFTTKLCHSHIKFPQSLGIGLTNLKLHCETVKRASYKHDQYFQLMS